MHFPWKARGPATFGLDSWRLSVSNELVHDCEYEACNLPWSSSTLARNANQLRRTVHQAGAAWAHRRLFPTQATVIKHAKVKHAGKPDGCKSQENKVKKCKILQHKKPTKTKTRHKSTMHEFQLKRPTESGTLGRKLLRRITKLKFVNSTFGSGKQALS